MPVDHEQQRAKHHAVIPVELVADGGDQLCRIWPCMRIKCGACGAAESPGVSARALPWEARPGARRATICEVPAAMATWI
jgi:hypothetical protein